MAFQTNNIQQNAITNDANITYNAGSGTGRVLLVFIGIDDNIDQVSGITYNGVALTRAQQQRGGTSQTAELWYLENPAAGSNTLAVNASSADDYNIITTYVSDANPVDAIGAVNGKTGDSTTVNVDITPQQAGSLLLAVLVSDDDSTALSPTGGSTELSEMPNNVRTGLYSKISASTSSHNIAATCGNDDWAAAAIEILPISSVNTNSQRSAKITGSATTNSTRGAKILGTANINSERDSKLIGQEIDNDERNARLNGIAVASSDRNAKVIGTLNDDDERNARLNGIGQANSNRSAKIHGTDNESDERDARLIGIEGSNDERDAKIHGTEDITSNRNAKITGKQTSNDERDSKLTGTETAFSTRSSKLTGQEFANSERGAKLLGSIASMRSAKLTGTLDDSDERNSKLIGQELDNSERDAKLTGTLDTSSERGAKLIGGVSSERDVKIYAGFEFTVSDDFSTTDNKDAVNTTAKWEGDGSITLQ